MVPFIDVDFFKFTSLSSSGLKHDGGVTLGIQPATTHINLTQPRLGRHGEEQRKY